MNTPTEKRCVTEQLEGLDKLVRNHLVHRIASNARRLKRLEVETLLVFGAIIGAAVAQLFMR
jgi:hypothetical protein